MPCIFVLTTAGSLFFLKHPSNQIININHTATFECLVNGSNTATIKWQKDRRLLSNRNVKTYKANNRTTSNLTLDRATVKDSGKYQCKATNADNDDILSLEAELISNYLVKNNKYCYDSNGFTCS